MSNPLFTPGDAAAFAHLDAAIVEPAIDAAIAAVLAADADKVAEYRGGKEALFGFFVGQTMKAMAGKANPKLVNERLRALLASA